MFFLAGHYKKWGAGLGGRGDSKKCKTISCSSENPCDLIIIGGNNPDDDDCNIHPWTAVLQLVEYFHLY